MKRSILPLALSALVLLGGCATSPLPEPPPAPSQEDDDRAETGAETGGMGEAEGDPAATTGAADCPPTCDFARSAIDEQSGILSDRTIYFEFDSSEVQDDYMGMIERHAAYLSQYPDIEVRLEGHTDERGSREYNIALGARRADSVLDLLQVYGVGSQQIETISYGEEMPAESGSNEDAWSENRRVELVYPDSAGGN
jgi:peptidoglycan-associated lipoprotein